MYYQYRQIILYLMHAVRYIFSFTSYSDPTILLLFLTYFRRNQTKQFLSKLTKTNQIRLISSHISTDRLYFLTAFILCTRCNIFFLSPVLLSPPYTFFPNLFPQSQNLLSSQRKNTTLITHTTYNTLCCPCRRKT